LTSRKDQADAVQEQGAGEVHVQEAPADSQAVGQEDQVDQAPSEQEAQKPLVDQACAIYQEAFERHAAANNYETAPISRNRPFHEIPLNQQESMRAAMAELLAWMLPQA